jgi:hypothetical protein
MMEGGAKVERIRERAWHDARAGDRQGGLSAAGACDGNEGAHGRSDSADLAFVRAG